MRLKKKPSVIEVELFEWVKWMMIKDDIKRPTEAIEVWVLQ